MTDEEILEQALGRLAEHFDTVRIFVGNHDGSIGHSGAMSTGTGDFYSQMGQIREWVQIQDERVRLYAQRDDEENRQ